MHRPLNGHFHHPSLPQKYVLTLPQYVVRLRLILHIYVLCETAGCGKESYSPGRLVHQQEDDHHVGPQAAEAHPGGGTGGGAGRGVGGGATQQQQGGQPARRRPAAAEAAAARRRRCKPCGVRGVRGGRVRVTLHITAAATASPSRRRRRSTGDESAHHYSSLRMRSHHSLSFPSPPWLISSLSSFSAARSD